MAYSKPPCAFWPLTISAANNKIDFTLDGGTALVATIASAVYYSAADLLTALASAILAAVAPDLGVTWAARTIAAGTLYGAAYGNGTFVTVGPSQAARSSTDGVTWTPSTLPTGDYYAVAYGGGVFVAVGDGVCATSADGAAWTPRTIPAGVYTGVAYGGGVFAAVGAVCATSATGTSWSAQTIPAALQSVCYGNGTFVGVGTNACATSPTGVTWTPQTISSGAWTGVVWGGDRFMAVGYTSKCATSPTGVTWTDKGTPTGSSGFCSVEWTGSLFVCAAYQAISTSTDGAAWTTTTTDANTYRAITFGNGLLAAFATSACKTSGVLLSVSVSSTGRFTISTPPKALVLKWATGANASNSARYVLGWTAADTGSATSHTAPYQHQNGWYPERACTFDSREEYERLAASTLTHTGVVKQLFFGSAKESRRVGFAWLPEWKAKIAREGASHPNEALERLWRDGSARFRWWPDTSDSATYVDLCLDGEALAKFMPDRDDRMQLYSYLLKCRRFV